MRRSTRQPPPEPAGRTLSPGEPVNLVAITQNPDDAETLRQRDAEAFSVRFLMKGDYVPAKAPSPVSKSAFTTILDSSVAIGQGRWFSATEGRAKTSEPILLINVLKFGLERARHKHVARV